MGGIAFITLPLSTYVERLVGDPSFDTFYLRALAGCFGLIFIFYDRLPRSVQNNLAWIWIASVSFVLPFTFGAILTFNAALTPAGESPSPVWVYQYLVALFLFIQLVNHGPLSAALWSVATALVILLLLLVVNTPNLEALHEAWLLPFPVYLTALIVGSITNRNVHIVQSEQLRAASAIGTNIAHELRTPLASIRALSRGIGKFLPDLVQAYTFAKQAGARVEPIAPYQLVQLASGLESIRSEVAYSNTIIDMLLANTRGQSVPSERFDLFRISSAIEEAVGRFPFNNSREKKLISYSIEEDFIVFAPQQFIVHVLFNLIKNSLYFVQRAGDGKLELVAKLHGGAGVVDVTDTGTGIPASVRPRIFDRFFSADPASQGAGIGLSFCKMVMQSVHGSISCDSQEGEYTTFRLLFPDPRPV